MVRLSKTQFSRAIEGKPAVTTEEYAVPSSPHKSKRASRIIITALIATVGIGAGWIGGKVLNGRISRAPAAAPASDALIGEKPAANTQPPESAPHAKRNSGVEKPPDSRSEPASETEQPLVTTEPPFKDAASREAPPKVPRVDKEEEADTATGEDPSKEIGRKALKKMSKENKNMKRDLGNKNENDKN